MREYHQGRGRLPRMSPVQDDFHEPALVGERRARLGVAEEVAVGTWRRSTIHCTAHPHVPTRSRGTDQPQLEDHDHPSQRGTNAQS